MLLARATARNREIALRVALGARRGRLIRQLLTESVLLSFIGGVFGLILGSWGLRALLAISPGNIPRAGEITAAGLASALDWNVLGFTVLISLLTGVIFGLVPALQISKPDLNSALKENSSRSATGRHSFARNLLIVSEVSLSLVLLIGAALLIRTFVYLRSINPGFAAENVLTLQTSLNGTKYSTTARVETLTRPFPRASTFRSRAGPICRSLSRAARRPAGSGTTATSNGGLSLLNISRP
ncbi:MAG: hypothetical protein DMG09_20990 [Acidobacteria bacterium]|nr:MAG: hypothetical protein DMG09_20990 [Acidobacteriota bacterium]